ncbi:MAG: ABC transporter ATP-binding protein [Kofleriaceae bacterium]|nr:ABC transporter ATP-binding protein [Kofleriaceae bacterium]
MILVEGVDKHFGGREVLSGLHFSLKSGEVVGFIGANGAGKTTTLRILSGFLNADRGTVKIAGHDIIRERQAACALIGYMPEGAPLYDDMRVSEYLRFRAKLKGVARRSVAEQVARVVEDLELKDYYRTLNSRLSKGYRQRVALADALIADPKVLILDEPTSGLDPLQRRAFRELLRKSSDRRCVLFSSHVLPELEAVVSRFLVLNGGTLVADGDLASLREIASLDETATSEEVFTSLMETEPPCES